MKKVEINPKKEVLNVDITGEIYVVNDEFSNQNIEKRIRQNGSSSKKKPYR